jgi:hypothetical protein
MHKCTYTLLLTLSLSLSSCETVKENTLLGIGIGSIVGAAAGAASSSEGSSKRALTGAAAGAAIGGLAGFLYKKQERLPPSEMNPSLQTNSEIPSLTMPKIRRVWVPDQISGKKLIKGHFIYLIEKEGRWKIEEK